MVGTNISDGVSSIAASDYPWNDERTLLAIPMSP